MPWSSSLLVARDSRRAMSMGHSSAHHCARATLLRVAPDDHPLVARRPAAPASIDRGPAVRPNCAISLLGSRMAGSVIWKPAASWAAGTAATWSPRRVPRPGRARLRPRERGLARARLRETDEYWRLRLVRRACRPRERERASPSRLPAVEAGPSSVEASDRELAGITAGRWVSREAGVVTAVSGSAASALGITF